jgi:hypothetical protein
MTEQRVSLYGRLPEILRIRDEELAPSGQLRSYLGLFERAFGAIHENIESLYHDLFIETCDDWVTPYIGDLLGTSHLAGDPWALRADVADTIALRRRKGTLGAIELLVFDLTKWGVHCVELRENLVWQQHLNHQRPDEGGRPPYSLPTVNRFTPIRGGTIAIRDPALLSLLGTPFDPFAHSADVQPPTLGAIRYNLPNLAIFLWRLAAYRVPVARPVARGVPANAAAIGRQADFVARFDVHPLGQPVRLFNTARFGAVRQPPVLTEIDQTPGPIPVARLSHDTAAGRPEAYVAVDTYAAVNAIHLSDVGLQLHVPAVPFGAGPWLYKGQNFDRWSFRGGNLCAWENGLDRPVDFREVVIDPVIGRIVIGVADAAEGTALVNDLLLSHTYGAAGPVGAHPISRAGAAAAGLGTPVATRLVDFNVDPNGLRQSLDSLQNETQVIVVEIGDSMVHDLDLAAVSGTVVEAGGPNLRLNRPLVIRAADGQRPIIRLRQPLRFRPTRLTGANPTDQGRLTVRLEGLYLTRGPGFPAGAPLIARAALNRLEIIGCTLDPGGFRQLDGTRAPIRDAMRLAQPYGFANAADETAFNQTPAIIVQRSIAGPLLIDVGYNLTLEDAIVDAGRGVADDPDQAFAVSGATDPVDGWGPPTGVSGATLFGRMRVWQIGGQGGIWVHALEVLNNQKGCLKYSYFSGVGDRLPQHHACVVGTAAKLRFTQEWFSDPAYGQLALSADFRIRERGPKDDAMGAFGFLLEAHKWRNLQIRFREFMPVGVRPLLIPVT